jgi:hypothetical protein
MKVRIYATHTHAGKRHVPGPEGFEIEMSDADAKWLKEHTNVLDKPQPEGNTTEPKKA